MANKKEFLSVIAASVLAASFTMTGCGSSSSSSGDANSSSSLSSSESSTSSSSSESNTSSSSSESSTSSSSSDSSSSEAAQYWQVRVSDAYVLGAEVKTGTLTAIELGHGGYEFNTSNITAAMTVENGANDLDGDNKATSNDPLAPVLKAPAGYKHINPFTTMLVDGKSVSEIAAMYPAVAAATGDDNKSFNVNVVELGGADIAIAKETAMAALVLSGYQTGSSSSEASSSEASSSEASSSSEGSSSSSSGATTFPAAARAANCTPDPDAFTKIAACASVTCINGIVQDVMTCLNGSYDDGTSSSSEEASSSEGTSSSEEASSSEGTSSSSGTGTFPAASR